MMYIRAVTATLLFVFFFLSGRTQPGAEIEVEKPVKYENRKLGAEKTGEKKFTIPRKFYQNTVTHYNYFFNANSRLNDVVTTAKTAFKEDYSQLLPFYNYSLLTTSQNKEELDSIIYKCTAGILLHDLRNSWIDNLYLILAKAYFYRNDLDSAGLTLQYINFSYAPKEDNYDIPIGSNASNDIGEFSIATKEKRNLVKKVLSRPPSRNESFIWQIRTNIEKNELPEAAGIIEILRHDPNFPKRLETDLNEVLAYWFYKQQAYDSAAGYLTKALDNAANKQEKARWEYLAAQMYQLSKKYEQAVDFYNRSISHTTDPVLDVYARLNSIRIQRNDKKDYLQENINALLKMAKRDKYENYRDIIYYAAATIEMERNGFANAQADLLKSVRFSVNNPAQRSQSFLMLADLNYNQKHFPAASAFYDSLEINQLNPNDQARINARKPPLKIIADNALVITKEDSVQALAKLPAAQRDAIIKKEVKKLRKEQGLTEEESTASVNPAVVKAPDLFADNSKSNEFYFYNAASKARGFSEFRARWGERPNVDNWQRKAAVDKQVQSISDVEDVAENTSPAQEQKAADNSYEGLMQKIPLTPEKLEVSNKSIEQALYSMANTFISGLEEYPSAIETYEELLRRFPNTTHKEEALFNLSYAYNKTGDKAKSDQYKNRLLADTADNKWTKLINNPNLGKQSEASPATKKYEDIYNLFIEGRFTEAKNQKKIADSLYDKSFWTPQLLFIESIYYIKQKEDTTAIKVLTDLSTMYSDNAMAERAKTMIDVLKRRKEIEDYLTKLEVSRDEELPSVNNFERPKTAVVTTRDTTRTAVVTKTNPIIKKDTAAVALVTVKKFSFAPSDSQYVAILLDKVDPVYASEARNAFNRFNQEKYYNQKINISAAKVDDRFNLMLQGPFADAAAAVEYIDKVRPVVKSRILPWLSAEKYSFIIISNANLSVLQAGKDMDSYKALLQKVLPGKF